MSRTLAQSDWRAAETDRLRAELHEARERVLNRELVAFLIALRIAEGPARAELSLRRIAARSVGEERETYIRAAGTVANAMAAEMDQERAAQERMWQELDELRRAQVGAQ